MAVSLSVERNKNQYKPQPLQGLFLFLFHFSLLLSFVLRKYGLRGSEQLGNGRGSGINAGTETGPIVEINDGETPIGAHDGIASIDGNACGLQLAGPLHQRRSRETGHCGPPVRTC